MPTKKKSDVENLKLRKFCSRLWLKGNPVWSIADAAYQTQETTTDEPSVMSGLIRAWRKQEPKLFPLRHKKHAPRRKSTSYDITLRFDAEKFGEFIPEYFPNGKPDPNGGGEWVGDSAEKLNKRDKRTFDQLSKKQQLSMIQYALRDAGLLSPKFTQILSIK